jgi:hypothetical protein
MDTLLLTKEVVDGWKKPPFQRELQVNENVRTLIGTIKDDGGVVPGIVTLGKLGREIYLIDGQHRIYAWKQAKCLEGYADVCIHEFQSMADMGRVFVELQSSLVKMRPDDNLRGLEESTPALRRIRERCPFVGYDHIRRGTNAPILSIAVLLRAWTAAKNETPASVGASATKLAREITDDDVEKLCAALRLFETAWGRDVEYARLWGRLNLVLCLWIYRVIVLTKPTAAQRYTMIDLEQFKRCAMGLSADSDYVDWLLGRNLNERDRSPAYTRIKSIIVNRYQADTGQKMRFPQPAWASHSGK